MVKVRTLVPLTHPTTEEAFGAGVEVDVADDVAAEWRAMGKVAYIADEEAAIEAARTGHYGDVTGREDAGQPQAPAEQPGPQSDEELPRKGRK